MKRLALALAAVLAPALALAPQPVRADPPRAEGRIETDQGRVEILGQPVRIGEKVELPEGFIRVEEKGTEDEGVGSFSVVPAQALASAPRRTADEATPRAPAPPRDEGARCRAERAAYLAELWKQSGIDVSHPDALLEGLEAGAGGPQSGYYWFAMATDAFRPLAWSSSLRARAEALVRCVRED